MITITARCPYCDQTFRAALHAGQALACPQCHKALWSDCPDWTRTGPPIHCLACPSRELFVRKDFPQRLGVGIVIAGFIASSLAWYQHRILLSYAILFATALADVLLYLVMGNVLECYRCHAQYRGLASLGDQAEFNLELYEKHRQQAARLKTAAAGSAAEDEGSATNRSVLS
jgi:hypothetical protein